MTKTGRVKFRDRAKRYGYIISSDASGPRDTLLFEADDSSTEFDALEPGSVVEFEVDVTKPARHAKNVKLA